MQNQNQKQEACCVCLLGAGYSGVTLQAPFFENHPGFLLKGVISSKAELPHSVKHCTKFSQLAEALANDSWNLISICTPNHLHSQQILASLAAGKHVMIEKPICLTLQELETIHAEAIAQKKLVKVFQNRRYDSDILTLQQLIQDRVLGEVSKVIIRMERFREQPNPKQWKEIGLPGTGLLYDLGPHLLDTAWYLFGIPESYSGELYFKRSFTQVDDAFDITLYYPQMEVQLKASIVEPHPGPRFEIFAANGHYQHWGADVQETQLVQQLSPLDANFGKDVITNPANTDEVASPNMPITVIPGRWMTHFDQLWQQLNSGMTGIIDKEAQVFQIGIIEALKQQFPNRSSH